MNVIAQPAKSRPFPKRKQSPIAAQATGSAETFVRYVVSKARGAARALSAPRARSLEAVSPATRGCAPSSGRLPSRRPTFQYAGARGYRGRTSSKACSRSRRRRSYSAPAPHAYFDRYASICVPDLFGIDGYPPAWVASGDPAPVGELPSSATDPRTVQARIHRRRHPRNVARLERRETDRRRAALENRVRSRPSLVRRLTGVAGQARGLALLQSAITGIDRILERGHGDAGCRRADRAAEQIAGGENFYFIGRSKRIAAMRQMYKESSRRTSFSCRPRLQPGAARERVRCASSRAPFPPRSACPRSSWSKAARSK